MVLQASRGNGTKSASSSSKSITPSNSVHPNLIGPLLR